MMRQPASGNEGPGSLAWSAPADIAGHRSAATRSARASGRRQTRQMTADSHVGGVWAPDVRQLTIGLSMTVTLVAFESLSVATILPVVSRQLGDLRLYGWVFSAFFLSSLVGIVVSGAVSDSRGIGLPLIGGLVVFGAGLAVAGTAPNMPMLVLGRVIQGFGAGTVPAAAYTAIGRAYPYRLRPRMFATLSTAWVVPGLVGPALAAQVATHAGWRWVFLGLLPLVAIAGVVTWPSLATVPGHDGSEAADIALPAAVMVAIGAGLLLAGLTAAQPLYSPLLIIGGAALGAPALRRLTPPGTLRARAGLPAAVLIRGLLTFGFFAGDAYVPLTLTSIRHTSTTFAGVTLSVSTIAWTAGSWVQAQTIARRGPRGLIAGGLALVVVGLAAMASLLWTPVPVGVALAAWAVAGLGMGIAYSPISLTALGWARPGEEGRVSASVQLSDVLGTALGTGVAGAAVAIVHQHGPNPRLGLGLAFAAAGVVALLGLAVTPRLPGLTTPDAPLRPAPERP
jgi:MFS family permease